MKQIIQRAKDGHVYFCRFVGNRVLLTNQYGCQTWVGRAYAKKLTGIQEVARG